MLGVFLTRWLARSVPNPAPKVPLKRVVQPITMGFSLDARLADTKNNFLNSRFVKKKREFRKLFFVLNYSPISVISLLFPI